MLFSENNWHIWQYANEPLFGQQTGNLEFKTYYSKINRAVMSFKEELLYTAKNTLDHYPNLKPGIFFSGGVDSEIMLRAYLEIGANPNVYIVRYENDYNIYDVSYAITICSLLNVNYKIIDFNLEKFYLNEAESISYYAQIDRPRALPYCKFIEIIDDLPIIGEGDPYWVRLNNDYKKKGEWRLTELETFFGWYKYSAYINKPAIVQFFKWSPGILFSHSKLKWFNNLVNDKYPGKLGTNSTKILGYREIYPDLINRKKKTGFEKIDGLVNEFEQFLQKKYNGLPYRNEVTKTHDELYKEIIG